MDYVQFGCGKEQQCCTKLLRKLPSEIQRYASEVSVPQQVIQIIRQKLEHQTQVIPPHEMSFQFH